MKQPDSKHQSLSSLRLLTILEYLSEKRAPARLTDIAKDLSLTQPTLLRYLSALVGEGYAYQDRVTGGYALTWRICRIGHNLESDLNLRSLVGPFLNDLSEQQNVGALFATERGGAVFYVDIAFNPGNSLDTLLRIGKDAPLHSTSSGKLLLSAHTDAAVERIITEKGLPKLTANTITNKKDLRKELAKIRENGYAIDNEECEEGHKCLSVPIRDYTGQICGAISAFDHSDVMSEQRMMTELLPACRKTAGEISARLGYSGSLSS